ncbi:MAG: FliM/FliN family flagellar motor C-terminal domain-containing protein [Vicinamibacterales bacterium]
MSSSDPAVAAPSPLDWVMDVPCPVDFVLGTATVKVRDCAQFAPNTIVKLRQQAGSDLEVRVGGVPLASGDVVIVDDNVALRLSRILSPGRETA